MKTLKRRSLLLVLAVVLALAAALSGACSNDQNAGPEEAPPVTAEDAGVGEDAADAGDAGAGGDTLAGSIMIAAAASLENALTEELIPLFNTEYPNVEVAGTYDSSGKLQEQIEGGLDAAIFFSAATKQMDALVEGGFIDGADVVNLLENDVVLITSVNSATEVTSFEDITKAASIAIGDPASVPAGQYAEESLTSIGVWDEVSASASLGTNVTEVLNWVAEGSAEVGIVYATDASSMPDKVKVLAVAPASSLNTPVIYPAAVLKGVSDGNKAAADKFMEFLRGDEATAVFEQYGFKKAA
jgi:molybdate transport system substrate-binding protein